MKGFAIAVCFVLTILCLVDRSTAIKCYMCGVIGNKEECHDPFNTTGKTPVECPAMNLHTDPSGPQYVPTKCATTRVNGIVTVRSCCIEGYSIPGVHCCEGDGCNSASKTASGWQPLSSRAAGGPLVFVSGVMMSVLLALGLLFTSKY